MAKLSPGVTETLGLRNYLGGGLTSGLYESPEKHHHVPWNRWRNGEAVPLYLPRELWWAVYPNRRRPLNPMASFFGIGAAATLLGSDWLDRLAQWLKQHGGPTPKVAA